MSSEQLIGAYTKKVPIHKLIIDYHKPFAMIAFVHARATRKYTCHSWLNAPDASDSSVVANLNAIGRHLGSHTMGKPVDTEGLPHVFHLCGRAGMLITTFYRQQNTQKEHLGDIRSYLTNWSIGQFITDEEILALSKAELYSFPTEMPDLLNFIRAKLFEAAFAQAIPVSDDFDMYSTKNIYDELFIAAMHVGKIFAIQRNGRAFINTESMIEEDVSFINHWFV